MPFFKGVLEHSGMAFVIVQHLDPAHKGLMAELLQRVSAMPVDQAQDRSKVEPNHVYVIPPNMEKAGATFVQAPTSAKFDSMPRSAIDAGLADVVAPEEDLPAKIMAYRQQDPFNHELQAKVDELSQTTGEIQ